MRRSLLLLSLLPALALGQFLPRKTTLNQTLNIDTTLNTDTVNGNVVDAGALYVAGDSELSGDLLVGGNLTVTGTSTQIGVASFGDLDAGTVYVTGAASVDGALAVGGTSTLAGDVTMADGGASSFTVDTFIVNLTSTLVGDVSIADAGASALTVDALTVNQSMAALSVDDFQFGNADGGALYVGMIESTGNIDGGSLKVAAQANLVGQVLLGDIIGWTVQGTEFGAYLDVDNVTDEIDMWNEKAGLMLNAKAGGGVRIVLGFDGNAGNFLTGTYEAATVLTGMSTEDGGAHNIQIGTREGNVWTAPDSYLVEVCNGTCADNLSTDVYRLNPLGDSTQAGDAGIAGSLSAGALEVPGTASVNGVLEFDIADGGALYLSGAAYLTSQETTGAASVNGLFEFDIGDGGYLGLSGALDVAGAASFGATTVNGYLGSTGDAGFNAIIATGGIQPNEAGSYVTFYLKTTHAAVDLADTATGACTALQTETVTGALLGDACWVSSGIALEAGGHLECAVTNTNEAKWQLCVSTGSGNINHAEDTFTIRVLR